MFAGHLMGPRRAGDGSIQIARVNEAPATTKVAIDGSSEVKERTMPNDRTTPAGTWQVEITAAPDATFEDRGLRGQPAEGLLVLEPDHTCLCLTPGPGAGTWQSDGSR